MTHNRHHPESVTLDLLNDLLARLDDLLVRTRRSAAEFLSDVRADPAQGSSLRSPGTLQEVITTNNDIERLIVMADRRHPRTIHQVLLELHHIYTKLGTLIIEIEQTADLGSVEHEPTAKVGRPDSAEK